jgi:hypothetical protein
MVDLELVTQLCRRATEATGGVVVDVVRDPLDDSLWVRISSWPRAQEALAALLAHGLSAVERPECRLQVTGWDVRLLRRRLGMLLAGVDDLQEEWDATAELTRYHHDRRAAAGEEPEDVDVLADVEKAMRGAVPIPHRAPGTDDVDTLLQLIEAAEDAYQQLIAEHLDYAARVLAGDGAAATSQGIES